MYSARPISSFFVKRSMYKNAFVCLSIVFHIPPSCCPGTEVFSKARPFRKGKQFQHLFLSSITQIVVMGQTPPLAINIISYALQGGGGSRIIYVPISI